MLKVLIVFGLIVLVVRVARFIRDTRETASYLDAHYAKKAADSVYKRNIRARVARKNLNKEWTGADL